MQNEEKVLESVEYHELNGENQRARLSAYAKEMEKIQLVKSDNRGGHRL